MSEHDWEPVHRAAEAWITPSQASDAIDQGTLIGADVLRRRLWWMWTVATIVVIAIAGLAFLAHAALYSDDCADPTSCTSPGDDPGASPSATAASTTPSPSTSPPSTAAATPSATASPSSIPLPPVIEAMDPSSGPTSGGTQVTITGTDLSGAIQVLFGDRPAAVINLTSEQLVATAPPGKGTVDVLVTTGGGTSETKRATRYTYVPAPELDSVKPPRGPAAGGTEITLTGAGFQDPMTVQIGDLPPIVASPTSPTEISVTTPALSDPALAGQPLPVVVTTLGGTSPPIDSPAAGAATFTYIPRPVVSIVDPPTGPQKGGNRVQISGTGLADATKVTFGDRNARLATEPTDTRLVVIAPPLRDDAAAGSPLPVTVTTPGGVSTPNSGATYTYPPLPTIDEVSPPSGPPTGGTEVTITGTGLATATEVSFGPVSVPVTPTSDTEIVVTTPAYPDNVTVDTSVRVRVTSPAGKSKADADAVFVYTGVVIR